MAGINKVILIGNLGKDPDILVFDNNKKASFSLATNESYKNKEGQWVDQTEWHNIICWKHLAEYAEKTLKKGMQVYIEGKLRTRKWEDKNGGKKYMVEIQAENITVLGRTNTTQNEADLGDLPV